MKQVDTMNLPNEKDFIEAVKLWMDKEKLTQTEAATILGTTHSTISRYLKGKRSIRLETATRWANRIFDHQMKKGTGHV